ncbi:nuclear envelope-associated protein 2-like isoform X2 [Aristolochia californica]|uniref:nuclear envelope-associated protein 2-like isoform X2 n=1 Tax=Aristolochia californica TaxID=171875 RepID=UPI0035DB24B8
MSGPSYSLEIDPLLKDLSEKKQSFRRNVVSLAAELKDVRSRLAMREESFAQETLTRQVAETKLKSMDAEFCRLQNRLEEKEEQLQASSTTTEQSAQQQCSALLRELDEKNTSLKQHEDRVNKLGEQLDILQKDLQAREDSQKQLKDEVLRIEQEIMTAVSKAGYNKDCELRKILEEVSPKNFEKINKHLRAKDEEIARLRDEIRIMSANWKIKTKELESQLEKHRRADQELKKRVLKLEFCLQEARSQTRKLQRMGERRDKALKELRDQLTMIQHNGGSEDPNKQNFWDRSGFKIVVSMSMLVLVVFAKR